MVENIPQMTMKCWSVVNFDVFSRLSDKAFPFGQVALLKEGLVEAMGTGRVNPVFFLRDWYGHVAREGYDDWWTMSGAEILDLLFSFWDLPFLPQSVSPLALWCLGGCPALIFDVTFASYLTCISTNRSAL